MVGRYCVLTCMLAPGPEIANKISVGETRVKKSIVAAAADINVLHPSERDGDTAVQLSQRRRMPMRAIHGKEWDTVFVCETHLCPMLSVTVHKVT